MQFVLLCEGSSDEGLLPHLSDMLVREGAQEALGESRWSHGTVKEKLQTFLDEDFPVHAIFIHRDADQAGVAAREGEIFGAARAVADCPPVIPVVPIKMTEALLLVDEAAIREVSGNPSGTMTLGLPPLARVESVANPKKLLKEALAAASGNSGARLSATNAAFNRNRRMLLNRVDPMGPVRSLNAWSRLEKDIQLFILNTPRDA